MKNLLLTTLCLLASSATAQDTTTTPARDYTMVNFSSDLTCNLLEIGTTSLTFSVEWSPDRDTPGSLLLVGKLIPETRGWSFLHGMDVNLANRKFFPGDGWDSRFPKEVDLDKRKAIFEVQYRVISWNKGRQHEREKFLQRAVFTVGPGIASPEEDWDRIYGELEEKKEEAPPPVATAEAEVQEGEKTSPSSGKVERLNGVVVEQEKSENESNPNRLWLYVCIVLGVLCAVLYFVRRKRT